MNNNIQSQNGKDGKTAQTPLSAALGILLAALSVLFASLYPVGALGIVCFGLAAAAFGVLYTSYRKPILVILPVLAALGAYFIGSSIMSAVFSVLPFAVGFIIARAAIKGRGAVSAIISGSLICALVYGAAVMLSLYTTTGGLSSSAIRDIVQSTIEAYSEQFSAMFQTLISAEQLATYSAEQLMLDAGTTELIVDYFMMILPALFAGLMNFYSALAAALYSVLLRITKQRSSVPGLAPFRINGAGAVIALLSLMLSFIINSGTTANLLFMNIFLLYLPGLAVYGAFIIARKIFSKLTQTGKTVLIILSLFVLLQFSYIALPLLAFIGGCAGCREFFKKD